MGEAWATVVKAEGSADGVQVSPTLWVPRRVDALVALAGSGIKVRAELRGDRPFVAVLTRLSIDLAGEPIPPAALSLLSQDLAKIAVAVLAAASLASNAGHPPQPKALEDSFRRAARKPSASKAEREDSLLHDWETNYEPRGLTQKQMAHEVGLQHGALRSYLTHARQRREANEPAKALVKALRVESRRAAAVSPDREDALLNAWETEYQPKGYSQAHMADMEGIKVSTLMTYLSRARKRRKPDA